MARLRPASASRRSPLFVNSVEKGMRVLGAFHASKRSLSLTEIAAASGLDMSAAQRFTHTLVELRYLQRDAATRTYALAPRLLDFANDYLASNELAARAAPYVHELAKATEEATSLALLDGAEVVFVLRVVSRNVLHMGYHVGSRIPAYCTAQGRAILSTLPAAEVDALLAGVQLARHTPHTVTEPRALRRRLAQARERGYAFAAEEYLLGDLSVAAPVTDATGRAIAAINVAVPASRWKGEADERRYAALVMTAAQALSAQRPRAG